MSCRVDVDEPPNRHTYRREHKRTHEFNSRHVLVIVSMLHLLMLLILKLNTIYFLNRFPSRLSSTSQPQEMKREVCTLTFLWKCLCVQSSSSEDESSLTRDSREGSWNFNISTYIFSSLIWISKERARCCHCVRINGEKFHSFSASVFPFSIHSRSSLNDFCKVLHPFRRSFYCVVANILQQLNFLMLKQSSQNHGRFSAVDQRKRMLINRLTLID